MRKFLLRFRYLFAVVVAAAGVLSSPAYAIPMGYDFFQDGYAEGAVVTGMFFGDDTSGDGQLSPLEITGYMMSFSGTSLVPAFTHDFGDLQALVYDIGSGFLGDGTGGLIEGIQARRRRA